MKRKSAQRPRLPRLTMFALSKRDLVAFVTAFESLAAHVRDLRALVDELSRVVASMPRPKPKARKLTLGEVKEAAAIFGKAAEKCAQTTGDQ